jgi:hypothetical protein
MGKKETATPVGNSHPHRYAREHHQQSTAGIAIKVNGKVKAKPSQFNCNIAQV